LKSRVAELPWAEARCGYPPRGLEEGQQELLQRNCSPGHRKNGISRDFAICPREEKKFWPLFNEPGGDCRGASGGGQAWSEGRMGPKKGGPNPGKSFRRWGDGPETGKMGGAFFTLAGLLCGFRGMPMPEGLGGEVGAGHVGWMKKKNNQRTPPGGPAGPPRLVFWGGGKKPGSRTTHLAARRGAGAGRIGARKKFCSRDRLR